MIVGMAISALLSTPIAKPHQTLLPKSTEGELGCNSESTGWDPKINKFFAGDSFDFSSAE